MRIHTVVLLTLAAATAWAGFWLGPAASWHRSGIERGYNSYLYYEPETGAAWYGGAVGFYDGVNDARVHALTTGAATVRLNQGSFWGLERWEETSAGRWDVHGSYVRRFADGGFTPAAGALLSWVHSGERAALTRDWGGTPLEDGPRASYATNDFFVAPTAGASAGFAGVTASILAGVGYRTHHEAGTAVAKKHFESGAAYKSVEEYRVVADFVTASASLDVDFRIGTRVGFRVWALGRTDLTAPADDRLAGKTRWDVALGVTPSVGF